jgi:Holliday junction resolvase RusA-like endonuclease
MAEIKYTILGDPRTKKNSMEIVSFGRKCPACGKRQYNKLVQSKANREFTEAALWQLKPIPPRPIECAVNVKCIFYMQTRRKVDGLNLLAAIDDLLVSAGILEDDNSRIVVGHDGSRVLYDKTNPRTEITITKIPADEQMSLFGGK